MSYLLLVIEPPGQRVTRSQAEGEEAFAQMPRFADDLKARNVLLRVNSLVSDTSGVRVQMRDGQRRRLGHHRSAGNRPLLHVIQGSEGHLALFFASWCSAMSI